MEDILASIKRQIRDDGRPVGQQPSARRGLRPAPVPPTPAPPSNGPDEDVLELDDPVDGSEPLVSQDAASVARQSLAALTAMRAAPPPADGGPLEAVVRDMLRPMLKEWLDEHLPQIVEELVTREIARITGRSL